jgi:hypothetical protein
MDVLSASEGDDKIAWYENDGQQHFTTHTITTAANGAQSVYAADVDGDGDMDVLSASRNDDKIAWYKNDGQQTFAAHIITTDAGYAQSVYTADVDGDGDMDVLSASAHDDKIAWYENLLITSIETEPVIGLPDSPMLYPNYPNPFNARTTIAFDLPAAGTVTLKVYDLSGRLLATLVDQSLPAGSHKVRFNAGELASGIYFYAIRTGTYSETRKMVLLK